MNRIVRIFFLVSLLSAIGLSVLALPAHADRTQTGGAVVKDDKDKKKGADNKAIEIDINDFLDDHSKKVLEDIKAGRFRPALGREEEVASANSGLGLDERKARTVTLVGDDFNGKSTVVDQLASEHPEDTIWRFKSELLDNYPEDQQKEIVHKAIQEVEKRTLEKTSGRTIFYVHNASAMNTEAKPIAALTQAINQRRGVRMLIETNYATNEEIFVKDQKIKKRIKQDTLKPAQYDSVIFHLRKVKGPLQERYKVMIPDQTLAEVARLAMRFYPNSPFEAAENILGNAAYRTVQELRNNTTEAMKFRNQKIAIQSEIESIEADIKADPDKKFEGKPTYSEKLKEANDRLIDTETKLSNLTRPDITTAAQIAQIDRDIDDLKVQLAENKEGVGATQFKDEEARRINDEISKKSKERVNLLDVQEQIRLGEFRPSNQVTLRHAQVYVSEHMKIPLSVLTISIDEALKNLLAIKNTVIGQGHIIEQAAESIAANRAERAMEEELARRKGEEYFAKPIWSAMFAGSTGTGKTELVKQIAKQLGIPESDILRFDMNEYKEKHAASRLIGPPPGYVGFEEGGLLTNGVAEREYRVILFDEIEKAHPELFEILMSALDEGHITSGQGKKVRLGNTIILFTTNLGQELTTLDSTRLIIMAKGDPKIKNRFTPEQIEKMSEMQLRQMLFKSLAQRTWGDAVAVRVNNLMVTNNHTEDSISTIVRQSFQKLAKNFGDYYKVKLFISENAMAEIESKYSVNEGARGVKQAFRDEISNKLNLMARDLQPGEAVLVDFFEGKWDFVKASPEDVSRIVLETKAQVEERRVNVLNEIVKNQGEAAAKTAHPYNRYFDEDFMVRNAVAKILKRFRK